MKPTTLDALIGQDPLQRKGNGSPRPKTDDPWPKDLHFTDSPQAVCNHGSNLQLPKPNLESFCGSSAVLCAQHPMAGIAAINRNGT